MDYLGNTIFWEMLLLASKFSRSKWAFILKRNLLKLRICKVAMLHEVWFSSTSQTDMTQITVFLCTWTCYIKNIVLFANILLGKQKYKIPYELFGEKVCFFWEVWLISNFYKHFCLPTNVLKLNALQNIFQFYYGCINSIIDTFSVIDNW